MRKANALNEIISQAVTVLRGSQSLDDDRAYHALVETGIAPHLAARLIEFLPIAYCRLILANSGAQFPDTFRRGLADGSFEERALSLEPVWSAAVAYAREEAARGVSHQDLLAIAGRSAEFDAANQLLNRGSKLENVVFTPTLLVWSENGPEDSNEGS